jgi:DNA mismatch endonuclease (patch repair protein)
MEKAQRAALPHGRFENVDPIRRKVMSRIRARNNRSTEVALRMVLVRSATSGWVLNARLFSSRPDVYFPRKRVAVFVDGCFWHFCPRCGRLPNVRRRFWREKFKSNRRRDRRETAKLTRRGIRVVRIWEHELNTPQHSRLATRLGEALRSRTCTTRKRLTTRGSRARSTIRNSAKF